MDTNESMEAFERDARRVATEKQALEMMARAADLSSRGGALFAPYRALARHLPVFPAEVLVRLAGGGYGAYLIENPNLGHREAGMLVRYLVGGGEPGERLHPVPYRGPLLHAAEQGWLDTDTLDVMARRVQEGGDRTLVIVLSDILASAPQATAEQIRRVVGRRLHTDAAKKVAAHPNADIGTLIVVLDRFGADVAGLIAERAAARADERMRSRLLELAQDHAEVLRPFVAEAHGERFEAGLRRLLEMDVGEVAKLLRGGELDEQQRIPGDVLAELLAHNEASIRLAALTRVGQSEKSDAKTRERPGAARA